LGFAMLEDGSATLASKLFEAAEPLDMLAGVEHIRQAETRS